MGVAALLSQRVTVLAPSRQKTGKGGWTDSYSTVATVPGRLQAAGEGPRAERLRGDQATGIELVRAYLDVTGVALEQRHRLQADGSTYEILEIDRQGSLVACLARRV